jgi:hypothetical protein
MTASDDDFRSSEVCGDKSPLSANGQPSKAASQRTGSGGDTGKGLNMPAQVQKTAYNREYGSASSRESSSPANIPEPKRAQNIAELAYELWQFSGMSEWIAR